MERLLLENIITAIGGSINNNINTNDIYIEDVCIDTRKIKKGDLFIAIKGENFDGHNFIEEAFKSGAVACISEQEIQSDNIVINVDSTREAIKNLASYYRDLFDIKVIAITGSTGKTTVKDIITNCLLQKYNVVNTKGNFNNEIGLPLTIFNINRQTEIVVLEMGMNHLGEIRELSKIAKPDIAIITNIGIAHIENIGSRDGILRAKYEIFDHLKDDGIKIFNGDCDMLGSLYDSNKEGLQKEKYFYSTDKELDAYATNIEQHSIQNTKATLNFFGQKIDVNIKYSGIHMVSNLLPACIVSYKLGLNKNEIKNGIDSMKLSKGRLNIMQNDRYTIIDDCYNANPTSMKASIDILANAKGRKVAILGDMLELGEYAEDEHYKIGEYLAQKNIDKIILLGNLSYHILQGTKYHNKDYDTSYYKAKNNLLKDMKKLLKKGDTILIKASRGMALEDTIEEIMR